VNSEKYIGYLETQIANTMWLATKLRGLAAGSPSLPAISIHRRS